MQGRGSDLHELCMVHDEQLHSNAVQVMCTGDRVRKEVQPVSRRLLLCSSSTTRTLSTYKIQLVH